MSFLGAFAKLRKPTINFVVSVRLSAWNNSTATGKIFIKFEISVFFRKFVEKIQVSLTSDMNIGYFTRRPVYMYDNMWLNSFYNEKYFKQNL